MLLVDAPLSPTEPKAMPSQVECRRRRVVGVDMWIEAPLDSEQVVYQARAAAIYTHLRLAAVFNGIGRGSARENEDARLRLRFLARQEDVHITDEAIFELVGRLSTRLRWSDLVKLEEFDGIPAFVPLPSP